MPDYDNDNTGALFVNDRKREGKKDADRNGSATIDGVEYWVNGWIKKPKGGGQSFLSLSFKRKDAPKSRKQTKTDEYRPDQDEQDDIPF